MSDFKEFVDIVDSIQDHALLEDFLVAITTQKERDELVQRIHIVQRLVKGVPQLQISKDLGVGIATVTRGSKELASGRFKVLKQKS